MTAQVLGVEVAHNAAKNGTVVVAVWGLGRSEMETLLVIGNCLVLAMAGEPEVVSFFLN